MNSVIVWQIAILTLACVYAGIGAWMCWNELRLMNKKWKYHA